MTTPADILRQAAARSFKVLADRQPSTIIVAGEELTGILETLSGAPVVGPSGIQDGFTGIARIPWYRWDGGTTYSTPLAGSTLKDIANGTVTVNGTEYSALNASLDPHGVVLTIKIGGLFDA